MSWYNTGELLYHDIEQGNKFISLSRKEIIHIFDPKCSPFVFKGMIVKIERTVYAIYISFEI